MAMPGKGVWFTTSWDDGAPSDLRLADLLDQAGVKATFYCPARNIEGRPTMDARDIRRLGERFEIGAHTLEHRYLTQITLDVARSQIADGKRWLEDALGHPVYGFCYPGGRHNANLRRQVAEAGFRYARTASNLHLDAGDDPFLLPTSFQFYPHCRLTYVKNFLRHGDYHRRVPLLRAALRDIPLLDLLRSSFDVACRDGGVFHLWGHSWEVEHTNSWEQLREFLTYVTARTPLKRRVDNRSLIETVFPHRTEAAP